MLLGWKSDWGLAVNQLEGLNCLGWTRVGLAGNSAQDSSGLDWDTQPEIHTGPARGGAEVAG